MEIPSIDFLLIVDMPIQYVNHRTPIHGAFPCQTGKSLFISCQTTGGMILSNASPAMSRIPHTKGDKCEEGIKGKSSETRQHIVVSCGRGATASTSTIRNHFVVHLPEFTITPTQSATSGSECSGEYSPLRYLCAYVMRVRACA